MGNYFFAKDGNKVYFKLTGILKYTTSGHFDTFLDDFIAHDTEVTEIAIDLTEAAFLDSTNLGFLAKIAQFMLDKNGSRTTLYATSKDVIQTLCSVGFDQVEYLVKPYAAKGLDHILRCGVKGGPAAVSVQHELRNLG